MPKLAVVLLVSFLTAFLALPAWAGRKAELPNLVVEQVAMSPSSGKAGSTLTVDISVRNAGTANAGSYRVGLYLSQDTTLSPGTLDPLIGSSQFPVLAAGALYPPGGNRFSITGTIPADFAPGPYYIFVFIDYTDVVAESVEDNNTSRFSYTILPFQCSGLLATNPSVCSGHGICVADDTCTCEAAWSGATCATSACPLGCGAYAHCGGPNQCVCNSGYTMTEAGCKDNRCVGKEDWTRCSLSKAIVPAACFSQMCEELASNDSCGLAEVLSVGSSVSDSLWGHHAYAPVQLPEWSQPLVGRDAFYTVDLTSGICYRVELTTKSDLIAFVALRLTCDLVVDASPVAGMSETVVLDYCALETRQHVLQVVQQETASVKRPGWDYTLKVSGTGCVNASRKCFGTTVAVCDANTWVPGENCGERGCEDGVCGCTPGEKRCSPVDVGNVCTESRDCLTGLCLNETCRSTKIEECEGGVWSEVETCDTTKALCVDGACAPWSVVDGDQETIEQESEAFEDGDVERSEADAPDADESETGEVSDGDDERREDPSEDAEFADDENLPNADGDSDGDSDGLDTVTPHPTSGSSSSGGCGQTPTYAAWVLLSLLALGLLRRGVRV